jgi:hypothetical protein
MLANAVWKNDSIRRWAVSLDVDEVSNDQLTSDRPPPRAGQMNCVPGRPVERIVGRAPAELAHRKSVRYSALAICVFEQLDDIPRRIFEQDLSARPCLCYLTTEGRARFTQSLDHSVEILCHDHEAAPAARLGISPGLARTTGTWCVEEEMQILQR